MPATRQQMFALWTALAPCAAGQSTPQVGLDFDHLQLFIQFTKGSLTSITLKPQFSPDGATWFDVYDSALTIISHTFSADASYCITYGQNNSNSRMQPMPFAVPLWRFDLAISGTATGSSLTLQAMPYNVGGIRD